MHRPILPESLESITKSDYFPSQRHRWNTNEEIAAILISFERHEEWLSKEVKTRPKSGSMLLYSRKRVRYRRDGYCWKKRKDGKTTREDHMKLKVQGTECIYGCYVHSAILPTFHRRCYWLLQNPDIVLVHYLNVPYSDDNKVICPALNYFADNKKQWTKEELISELKPMFFSENEPDLNNELEISTAETIETIVQQLMVKQRAKVKALQEATDANLQTLTVVTAITNSARENSNSNTNNNNKQKPLQPKLTSKKNASMLPKREPACIITTPSVCSSSLRTDGEAAQEEFSQQKQSSVATQKSSVHLVHLANNNTTNPNGNQTTLLHPSGQTSPATPSYILSLPQFQNGFLILNSQSNLANELASGISGPVTFLYGRPANNNDSTVPAVMCSEPKSLVRTTEETKRSKCTSTENSIVNSTETSTYFSTMMDIANGNCEKSSLNDSDIADNENIGNGSEENSDAGSTDNASNDAHSNANGSTSGDSVQQCEESMIISTTPSPEHHPRQSSFDSSSSMSENPETSSNGNGCGMAPLISNPSRNNNNSNHNNYEMDPVDLNPMDFIDNDISTPEEELLSLEAFDMLTEFPNLDDLANTGSLSSSPNRSHNHSNQHATHNKSQTIDRMDLHGLAHITDFSPEWSFTEGGIKIIVVGPWQSSGQVYHILIDGVPVPTTLVQSGVLRCYSPAHEPGFVQLQVSCNGRIISNTVIFEYRGHSFLGLGS